MIDKELANLVTRSKKIGSDQSLVVYGGGNTALDAARTAKRLGARESIVVYRRTKEKMPAHESELKEALDEGIVMRWLSTISQSMSFMA